MFISSLIFCFLLLIVLRADNNSVGHGSWVNKFGWVNSRVPLSHFTLYSSGIRRDLLVHRKPATTIETVILTVC